MDVASLLTLLLLALALAVQPWSVLAGVLLLCSEGGVAKEVTYVACWVLALTAVEMPNHRVRNQSGWRGWTRYHRCQPSSWAHSCPTTRSWSQLSAMLRKQDSLRPGLLSSWSCSSSWPRLESQPHCCCWYSVGMRPLRSIRGGESG